MSTEPKRRGRPPKNHGAMTPQEFDPPSSGEPDDMIPAIPHHPPITADGFRDEALQAWLIEYYPDLANLAITGRITNHTQP